MEFQALFQPLHKGTIATIGRQLNLPPKNPFGRYGDKAKCVHYITYWDGEGLEVEGAERSYCFNTRMKLANGLICEFHNKEVFPTRRPEGWNPVVANQLDARSIVAQDAKIIRAAKESGKLKSVRLLTDNYEIKLHKVGYMRYITT